MLPCFVAAGEADARPVAVVPAAGYAAWLGRISRSALRAWLNGIGFEAKPGGARCCRGRTARSRARC